MLIAFGLSGCGGSTKPAGDENAEAAKGKAKKAKAKKAKANEKKHTCNICGSTTVFKKAAKRPSTECPVCKSRERHRLLIHYLEHGAKMFQQKLEVLHFSPQEAEETVLRHQPNWRYVTTDYEHTEDLGLDLTAIDQPNDSWDLVIVYHIFEHIIEDQKGMKELYRIVRPGGKAIVQVPLELAQAEIHEDPTITSAKERAKHFGQANHVRKYSIKGFRERLEAVGFQVEAVDYISQLDPAFVEKHRMGGVFKPPMDESIWVCTKPGGPAPEVTPTPEVTPKPAAAAPTPAATPAPATPVAPAG
jgi:SAM-dependent methyltransferase